MAVKSFWNMTSTNPVVIDYLEDATAGGFKAGDIVKVHTTTGKLRIAVANKAAIGIAQKDASGTVDTKIPVELFNTNDIYVGTHGGTSVITDNGDIYDFTASAGAFTVDHDSTAAATDFVVVGLYDAAAAGGRVMLRVLAGGNLHNKAQDTG